MKQNIKIGDVNCLCSTAVRADRIAYILYPMDLPGNWIEEAASRHATTLVAITGMDWQNVFSPWPAKGVPKGDPDFKGESPAFLAFMQNDVIPVIERRLGISTAAERSLVGVSMSGLFALWQWMLCDTFTNIASLSGSFWYEGFVGWMQKRDIPHKSGKAFFLLGNVEAESNVKAFRTVAADTQEIISLLRRVDIDTEFLSVPGNHFANPMPRLEAAFDALYPHK